MDEQIEKSIRKIQDVTTKSLSEISSIIYDIGQIDKMLKWFSDTEKRSSPEFNFRAEMVIPGAGSPGIWLKAENDINIYYFLRSEKKRLEESINISKTITELIDVLNNELSKYESD